MALPLKKVGASKVEYKGVVQSVSRVVPDVANRSANVLQRKERSAIMKQSMVGDDGDQLNATKTLHGKLLRQNLQLAPSPVNVSLPALSRVSLGHFVF